MYRLTICTVHYIIIIQYVQYNMYSTVCTVQYIQYNTYVQYVHVGSLYYTWFTCTCSFTWLTFVLKQVCEWHCTHGTFVWWGRCEWPQPSVLWSPLQTGYAGSPRGADAVPPCRTCQAPHRGSPAQAAACRMQWLTLHGRIHTQCTVITRAHCRVYIMYSTYYNRWVYVHVQCIILLMYIHT